MNRPGRLEFTFAAGASGTWRVDRITPVLGNTLPAAPRLSVLDGLVEPPEATWALRGVTGQVRYTTRAEQDVLTPRSEPLGRPEATRAALIPDPQERRVVGAVAGRATRGIRGSFGAHRHEPAVPASGRSAAAPRARDRRAVRLPDVVRVRPGRRRGVRGPRRSSPRHRGVAVRGPRGGRAAQPLGEVPPNSISQTTANKRFA